MTRAVVLGVSTPDTQYRANPTWGSYLVHYKILTKGRKPLRRRYFYSHDEMDAYIAAQQWLRSRGFKV